MHKNHVPQRCDGVIPGVYTRRQMLKTLTTGFGYMAFAGLATQSARAASQDVTQAADSSLLLPKQPHFAPRAKRVIDIFATLVLLFVVTVQTIMLFDKVRLTRLDHVETDQDHDQPSGNPKGR